MNRGHFKELTIVNWRGFFAETFELSSVITSLSGNNGAGKTTIMASMIATLMPDQKILNIKNTTESSSKSVASGSGLYNRIGDGFAYTLATFQNSKNEIVYFGVSIEKLASSESKMTMTMFCIEGLGDNRVLDYMLHGVESDTAEPMFEICSLSDISKRITSVGAKLKRFNKLTEYHNYLFKHGAIPKSLNNHDDRLQYYKILESSMYGGISQKIQDELRNFLLPENVGIKSNFTELDETLERNRATKNSLDDTRNQMKVFDDLIDSSKKVFMHLFASLLVRRKELATSYLVHVRGKSGINLRLADKDRQKAESEEQVQSTQLLIDVKEERASELNDELSNAKQVQNSLTSITKLEAELIELQAKFDSESETVSNLRGQKDKATQEVTKLEASILQYSQELHDIAKRFESLDKRAQQYKLITKKVNSVESHLGAALTVEEIGSVKRKLNNILVEISEELLKAEQAFSLFKTQKASYDKTMDALKMLLNDEPVTQPYSQAKAWVENHWKIVPRLEQIHDLNIELKRLASDLEHSKEYNQKLTEYFKQYQVDFESPAAVNSEYASVESQLSSNKSKKQHTEHQISSIIKDVAMIDDKTPNLMESVAKWNQGKSKLEEYLEESGYQAVEMTSVGKLMAESASLTKDITSLSVRKTDVERELISVTQDIMRYQSSIGGVDPSIADLALNLEGKLLAEFFDDQNIEEATFSEAEYGHLREAIMVKDLDEAVDAIGRMDGAPDDVYLIEGDFDYLNIDPNESELIGGFIKVKSEGGFTRMSKIKMRGVFGELSRKNLLETLDTQKSSLSQEKVEIETELKRSTRHQSQINNLVSNYSSVLFTENPDIELQSLLTEKTNLESEKRALEIKISEIIDMIDVLEVKLKLLSELVAGQEFFDADRYQLNYINQRNLVDRVEEYKSFIEQNAAYVELLISNCEMLQFDLSEGVELKNNRDALEIKHKVQTQLVTDIAYIDENCEHLSFADAKDALDDFAKAERDTRNMLETVQLKLEKTKDTLNSTASSLDLAIEQKVEAETSLKVHKRLIAQEQLIVHDKRGDWDLSSDFVRNLENKVGAIKTELANARTRQTKLVSKIAEHVNDIKTLRVNLEHALECIKQTRKEALASVKSFKDIKARAVKGSYFSHLHNRELMTVEANKLSTAGFSALSALQKSIESFHKDGVVTDFEIARFNNELNRNSSVDSVSGVVTFEFTVLNAVFEWTQKFLLHRLSMDSQESEDAFKAVQIMEAKVESLKIALDEREKMLGIKSQELVRSIKSAIRKEQKRISKMNAMLHGVKFGSVKGIKIDVEMMDTHQKLLEALSDENTPYQRLFNDDTMSIKQVLGRIYSELSSNPTGNSDTFEKQGNMLLDYRKYLNVVIKVTKGGDKWEEARNNGVSTGESIGVGLILMLMIVNSWEVESQRVRGNISPARLLFLDEAGRVDGDGNSTINELCLSQGLQMIVAQPKDEMPKSGIIYILRRYINGDAEKYDPQNEFVNIVTIKPEVALKEAVA